MVELTNGGQVIWAVTAPASPGMRPHGVVMAQYNDQIVVWSIALNFHRIPKWDALSGEYFPDTPEGYRDAKHMFGRRARRILDPDIRRGILHDDAE